MVPASKSGGKHEDGGFWRMKVREQGVNYLEFETRIDKDVIFAFGFARFGPEFERAGDGGADGDDAMAGSLCSFDCLNGFGRNLEPLRMHMVLLDIVATNWQESTKANMKSKVLDLNAFGFEFGEGFFGHVKTGSWSGGGAEFFGPNGLIALNVVGVGVAMEIWWKRNVAVGFDDIGEWAVAADGGGTVAKDFLDSDLVVGIINSEDVASVELATVHDGIKI